MTAAASWLPRQVVAGSNVWPTTPPNAEFTLPLMVAVVMASYTNPVLVDVAVAIAATAPEKNPPAIVRALMAWIRTHLHFVEDPIGEQLLKTPLELLAVIQRDGVVGCDCVDNAMLAAALAMAVGLTANFVSEGWTSTLHADLTHVYAIVNASGVWYALDEQRPANATPVPPVEQVRLSIP